jgi:hypothetical protein
MKKMYKLLVDQDIVPFDAIAINEDGTAINERNADKMFAYENNPTIINISDITSLPCTGDIYDPLLEGFPFVRQSTAPLNNFNGYGKFVLVIDNLVKMVIAFDLSTELGYKMNAAFSSNPQFLEPEIIE